MPAAGILALTAIPSPSCPCARCRAPGGVRVSTNLQDSSGGSAAQAAASSWGLGSPGSCGTTHGGAEARGFLPRGETRRPLHNPMLLRCQTAANRGAVTSSLQFPFSTIFPLLSPWHPESKGHQTRKPPLQLEKTQVCNLSKYNSVVPIKLKTEKWHKKNVHYFKLQFFICSLLLPHSLK